jgi:Membrane transporters of cations and cationic drugs
MIYLLLAIVSSSLVSIMMRLSEGRVKNNLSVLAVNYAVCILLAVFYTGLRGMAVHGEGAGVAAGLGAANGFLYLTAFILMQMNVRKNGVVLSTVFMKLGVMVPAATAILFFGERPAAVQVCGFVIALGAIVLIHLEKDQTDVTFKGGLILLLIMGGSGDAMAKVYEEMGKAEFAEYFLCCTFAAAFLLCAALTLGKGQRLTRMDVLFGALIGIPNYYSARFLLKSLSHVPAIVAYPTYSVSSIVIVSAAGVILFHEKMNRRRKAAVALVLAALLLLNM